MAEEARAVPLSERLRKIASTDIALPHAGLIVRAAMWFCMGSLLFGYTAYLRRADPDMFHQMALIREALSTGALPKADVFAYTPTVRPFVHHEWGTGALLYFVVERWGGAGVLVLRYLLLAGIIAACMVTARKRGAHESATALLAPLAILMFVGGLSPVRGHMFTFLGLAWLLAGFESDRAGGRKWLVVFLPLYVVWLNLHGGFVLGLAFFALYALERFVRLWHGERSLKRAFAQTRHLFAAGVALAAATLVNPYGWDYVRYLWSALSMDRSAVDEWAPLWDSLASPELVWFLAFSIVPVAYAVIRSGGPPLRVPGLPLLVLAAVLTVQHQRMMPVYAVVWFGYAPALLARTRAGVALQRWWRAYPLAFAAPALVAGSVLFSASVGQEVFVLELTGESKRATLYPVGATQYLRASGFRGNLMTPFNTGAFVSWELYPAVKVGMDSRYEAAYPPGAVEEHVVFYGGTAGWQEVLERYPTDAVLVARTSPLDTLIARVRRPDGAQAWPRVYRDDDYSIFARAEVAATLRPVDRSGERISATFD